MKRKSNHCKYGHELTAQNTRIRTDRNNRMECIECQRLGRAKFTSQNPLYDTWKTMIRRCTDPSFKDWNTYGGNTPAIRVCERWDTFSNFVEDMSPKPKGTTIDRKNSKGDYSPDNCKWSTAKEQARNCRSNHRLTIVGETLTIAEWAELSDLKYLTLFMRVKRGEPIDINILRPSQRL